MTRLRLSTLCSLAAALCSPAFGEIVVHVSTDGNDAWSGRSASPSPDRTDGPFASIPRAAEAVRVLRGPTGPAEAITVLVHRGAYRLTKTLTLGADLSGTPECPVTFRAAPGEEVILSGGQPVRGWRQQPGGTYVTSLAEQGVRWIRTHQLFFRGERQTLARYPNLDPKHPGTGGFLYVAAASDPENTAFQYAQGGIPFAEWGAIPQAEVNLFPYNCWDHNIIPIAEADAEARYVRLRYPVAGVIHQANRYFIQNVLAALDAPGEWYLDYSTGEVYFRPPDGVVGDGDVTIPVLENLVEVSGTPDAPVHDLTVQGFHLAEAEQDGIVLQGAAECRVIGNSVSNVGGVGINAGYLRNASRGIGLPWRRRGLASNRLHSGDRALLTSHPVARCRVAGNDVWSTGGDGIALVGAGNTADNNHVRTTGLFDQVSAAVTVCGNDNAVSHNNIHDTPRDAIFVNGARNTVEYNAIRWTMLRTADNAAIALRQHDVAQAVRDRGNVIRYNRILDTVGYGSYPHCTFPPEGFGSPFCSWGIYLDGSISGVTVYGNVIARSGACSIYTQFGGANTIENNVFVEPAESVLQFGAMLYFGYFMFADTEARFSEPPNAVRHNILSYVGGRRHLYECGLWGRPEWDSKQAVFDGNLISNGDAPVQVVLDPKRTYGSFADWQAAGHDQHSVVADPGFVDPTRDDYRLKPGSPAFALGFRDINAELARIGAYEGPERATWPLANVDLPHEDPLVFAYNQPPVPIVDGFELSRLGAPPRGALVSAPPPSSVAVTAEAASTGRHSLKLTDAPGLEHAYDPHFAYQLRFPDGRMRLFVDVMNSASAPADWYAEVRDWRGQLRVGPTFAGSADGTIRVGGAFGSGGQPVAVVPNGSWFTVEIDFETGPTAAKTYTLRIRGQGLAERVMEGLPYADPMFEHPTWFGVSSMSTQATALYVDNLILGPADAEDTRQAMQSRAIRGREREVGPPPKPVDPALPVLHWTFDDGNGLEARDNSGNGLAGTLLWDSRVTGAFGTALYCDGTEAIAEVEDSPLLRFGTEGFSIDFWVCPTRLAIDSAYRRRRLLDKGLYPTVWWNVDITSDGHLSMEMSDQDGHNGTTASEGRIAENKWTHVAIAVDRAGFRARYYLDGRLDSERELPPAFTGSIDTIGKSLTTGIWQPFIGLLDDLRIYRRVLVPDEIRAQYDETSARHMDAAFTPIGDE